MLRSDTWIDECIETFGKVSSGVDQDRCSAAWIRLAKINEQIHSSLSFDDLYNVANLSEPRVQLMISGFEKAFETWRSSIDAVERKGNAINIQYVLRKLLILNQRFSPLSVPPRPSHSSRNQPPRRPPTRAIPPSILLRKDVHHTCGPKRQIISH